MLKIETTELTRRGNFTNRKESIGWLGHDDFMVLVKAETDFMVNGRQYHVSKNGKIKAAKKSKR